MHRSIVSIEARVAAMTEKMRQTIERVQQKCRHAHVVEAPMRESTWLVTLRPFRVCTHCGLLEEDWMFGSWGNATLRDQPGRSVEKKSRDEAWKFRRSAEV